MTTKANPNRVPLTEPWLSKRAPDAKQPPPIPVPEGIYWDTKTTGFAVRIGKRFATFIAVYRDRKDGELVWRTIGRYRELGAGKLKNESWTVERARDEAEQHLGAKSKDADIGAPQRTKHGGPTLAEAAELYIENLRDEGARPKSIEAVEREIADRGDEDRDGSYLKAWLDRPLASIDGAECRERHVEITKKHGPHVANRVMRELRAIWNHVIVEAAAGTLAKDHGIAKNTVFTANPTTVVKWNTEKAGKLVTRRQEPIPWKKLPAWHKAVIALGEKSKNKSGETRLGSPTRRDYNLIVLLTGLRRNDAASIRWEHLNLTDEPAEGRVWHAVKKKWEDIELAPHSLVRPVPKGGAERSFVIPLSKQVVEILDRRKKENIKDNGWCFPTEALLADKDRARPCYLCQDLGMPPHEKGAIVHIAEPKEHDEVLVSPHRLRDTYTTALAEVQPKLSPYVIDVLTNHKPPRGSVTAGYIDLGLDVLAAAQQLVSDYIMVRTIPPKDARHLHSVPQSA